MKMFKLMMIGLAAMMVSGVASAQHTQELVSGGNNFLMTDCDQLANDVRLMMTGGVVGGIACDDVNNIVALSVCHTAGLTTNRSTRVSNGDPIPGGTCAEADGCVVTTDGSTFPSASTARGTVAPRFPGGGVACDGANSVTEAEATITDALAAMAAE